MYLSTSQPHPITHEILTNSSVELYPFSLFTPLIYSHKALHHAPPGRFQCGLLHSRPLQSFFFQSILHTAFKNHVPKQEYDQCYSILTKFQSLCIGYGVKYKCPTQHSNIYLASAYLSGSALHYTLLPRTTYICHSDPQIDSCSLSLYIKFFLLSAMFCSLCHSLLVYLLENQLKPAFPEAFPNLSVGISLFFINVRCVVLN